MERIEIQLIENLIREEEISGAGAEFNAKVPHNFMCTIRLEDIIFLGGEYGYSETLKVLKFESSFERFISL